MNDKAASNKGTNVGEMLKLQTKKIEELTLYLLDKDKQLTEQNKKLVGLQQQRMSRNPE